MKARRAKPESRSRAHQKSPRSWRGRQKELCGNPSPATFPSIPRCLCCSSLLLYVDSSAWMFRASLRSVSDPFRDQVCFACLARRSIVENSIRTSPFYRTYSSGPDHGDDELGAPPQPTDSSIRLPGKKPVCGLLYGRDCPIAYLFPHAPARTFN